MTTTTPSTPDFKAIETAAAQVKQAVADMNAERGRIKQEIEMLNARKQQLQGSVVTLADFRQFLCDYIDAKRQIFRQQLRKQIEGVMHPARPGTDVLPSALRPLLNFSEMETLLQEGCERGVYDHGWVAQLVTPHKQYISDLSFYFYFGEQIKQVIQQEFDSLGISLPAKYAAAEQLDRAMIRGMIQEIEQQIAGLQIQAAQLASKINQLGGTVKGTV